MLGDDVFDRVRVVNHDSRDADSLVFLGEHGNGVPVWLNRLWVDADVRITTGFVEPHFFAGFSGGPKMVAPGLAGLDTILMLHDVARIGDPRATWARDRGQPRPRRHSRRGRGCAAALLAGRDPQPRPAHHHRVRAARLWTMHRAACRAAREYAMQTVEAPFDVVVTSNSGFPLDQNLYQIRQGHVGRGEGRQAGRD